MSQSTKPSKLTLSKTSIRLLGVRTGVRAGDQLPDSIGGCYSELCQTQRLCPSGTSVKTKQ